MFPDFTCDDVFRMETTRLWLRWPRFGDAAIITQLAGNKAISEMTSKIPYPYPPDAAEAFVFQSRKMNASGQSLTLVATPKSKPNTVIGLVSILQDDEKGLPQIGYWLSPNHWGKGLMTEAVQTMVDSFFQLTEENILIASTRLINPASQRILEKCGFRYEGTGSFEAAANGQVFEVQNYAVTRGEWRENKKDLYNIPESSKKSSTVSDNLTQLLTTPSSSSKEQICFP